MTAALRHQVARIAAAFLFMIATASPGWAEVDLVGTWVLDEAALRADVDSVMTEQFADLPASARQQAETAMQLEVDRIIQTATGTIQFRADGTATATSADVTTEWVWTLTDGVVRLEKKEASVSDVPLLGTIDGNYLYLEPDVAGEPGLPLPLRRKS